MEGLSGSVGGSAAISDCSAAGRSQPSETWATPGELSALQVEQSRCAALCGAAAWSMERARSARRIAAHPRIQPARNTGRIDNSL